MLVDSFNNQKGKGGFVKTTLSDYIITGFLMSLLALLAFFLVREFSWFCWQGTSPVASSLMYILMGPIVYGLLSGIFLQVCVYFKPISEGEFSMDDSVFQYWKFLTMIHMFGERTLSLIAFPPFVPLIAKLFGAKIGQNVAIGGKIDSPFLVSIGENSVLGHGSLVSGNVITDNKIILGRVRIGNNTTLGVFSVVMPNTVLGNHATLVTGSVVVQGSVVPDKESWKGNPARKWQ